MIFKRHAKEYIKPKFIEINNLAVKLYEENGGDWDAVSKDLVKQGFFKEDVALVIDDLIKQQTNRELRIANSWIIVGTILFIGGLIVTAVYQMWIYKKVMKVIFVCGGMIVYGIYKREQVKR